MAKVQDLTGLRFGKLVVLERSANGKYGDAMWLCQCDCGNKKVVRAGDLRNGNVTSCRCLQREESSKRLKTHGLSRTRLYKIWRKVMERCYNENHAYYHRYGGRGITMCEEWRNDFMAFREWAMANGYADNLTIDREDNDKGYYPDNCRWITMKEQHNNTSQNHLVTMNGKTQNVTQWCEELDVNRACVYRRLKQGLSPEQAFSYKKRRRKKGES